MRIPEDQQAHVSGEVPPGHVCVLAVDPGVTTGLCAISVPADTIFEDDDGKRAKYQGINFVLYDQISGDEIDQAAAVCAKRRQLEELSEYRVPIVMENFVLRKFDQGDALLSPVRIMEQVKTMLRITPDPTVPQLFFQTPANAKRTVTDQRLVRWGLWIGKTTKDRHARDAERHAILFIRRCAVRTRDGVVLRNLAFGLAPKRELAAAQRRAGRQGKK